MIHKFLQIVFMSAAAGLSYWGWLSLNMLRGTSFSEYRYVIFLCGSILVFSIVQAVAGRIEARLTQDDH